MAQLVHDRAGLFLDGGTTPAVPPSERGVEVVATELPTAAESLVGGGERRLVLHMDGQRVVEGVTAGVLIVEVSFLDSVEVAESRAGRVVSVLAEDRPSGWLDRPIGPWSLEGRWESQGRSARIFWRSPNGRLDLRT